MTGQAQAEAGAVGATPRSARARRLRGALAERERAMAGADVGSGGGRPASGTTGLGAVELVRAPGRVNLIGEHTDYNEGWVLPAAIQLEIWIALRPHADAWVELTSLDLGTTARFEFDSLAPRDGQPGTWIDYVAGTAWALREAGLPVRGFRGVLDSTIPIGSGLSSSAAIEMASAIALLPPEVTRPSATALAAIGRRCENRYVGVKTGIMDQFTSVAGQAGHAMLLDCRSNEASYVPLPDGVAIVACHTGLARKLESSRYNERWADCQEGVSLLAERNPSVRALRDVDQAMLERHRDILPDRVWRRCAHVVAEDARVHKAVAALQAGDLATVGRLFAASHASLRDLYEVSSPELDALVEIANGVPGVFAARMTGAGFGGCTVNLVQVDAVEALRAAVMREYPSRTGLVPQVYVMRAVDGAGRIV